MKVLINGESRPVDDGRTLADLVRELSLEGRPIAIEINEVLVRKSEFAATRIKDGDRLEIVHFVGGG